MLTDTPSREEMILSLQSTVSFQARRLQQQIGRKADIEDLVSDAWVGAIDAVDRFDPAQATNPNNWQQSLRTFAARRIAGAMLDALRERDHLSRTQRSGASRIYADPAPPRSLDEMRAHRGHGGDSPSSDFDDVPVTDEAAERAFSQLEYSVALRQAMATLQANHRDVLHLYYFEGQALHMIGAKYGFTESRACQVLRDARLRLRAALLAEEMAA